MMNYEYYTVNVFSELGLSGGNQLAVILDAENLTEKQMLQITKQFNYSESTFVTKPTPSGAEVKIFIPTREIPFAGHPTIGTAFIIESLWRKENNPRSEITLNLKLGPISVKFTNKTDDSVDLCTMDQFPPKLIGETEERELVAELLGISINDLIDDLPLLKIAPTDLPFLFVPVKSPSVMKKLKPNFQRIVDEFQVLQGEPYVFTPQGIDGGQINARLFAPNSGVYEDPATGSAQASLSLYLSKLGLIDHPNTGKFSFTTEQGYQMGRPSKLYNELTFKDGKLTETKTGGKNYLVSNGKLFL